MNITATTLVLSCVLAMAGCATLNESQCRSVNWYELGARDGSEGHPATRLDAHRDACDDYSIRPDGASYLAGRDLGLRQYCVFDNAVREGLAGRSYQNVCPPAISQRFAELHWVAYAVYAARQNLESLNRKAESLERERRSDKTSAERRGQIRDELRAFDRKLDRARDEVRSRESDLDRMTRLLLH